MAAAAGALLLAVPPALVERWHAHVYLALQPAVTGFSSEVPFAWLDVLIGAVLLWLLFTWLLPFSGAARGRRSSLLVRAAWRTLVLAATIYLAFLFMWGLSYQRPPLRARLAPPGAKVDPRAVEHLGDIAVDELNRLHGPAHDTAWPAAAQLPKVLGPAFAEAQGLLGAPRAAIPAPPKSTLLGAYFRTASVAGLTNPYLLEVMITPDALPFERPAILAHEWGHLAGYAHEAEAEFVGWLTCVRGDDQSRYSAWLSVFPRLPREVRARVGPRVGPGPRADFDAIRARMERASPTVTRWAWSGYDHFLKAHHVEEGVASYDAVITLLASTRFDEGWRPRLDGQ